MATIDIREESQVIDTIRFADRGDLEQIVKQGSYILFKDNADEYVLVDKRDVGHLIKALQKALEIWWADGE
jgi:hypothetical protein